MRLKHGAAFLMIVAAASACDQSGSVSLENNDSKASYAIGQDIGRNLKPAAGHLDMDAFIKGIEDMLDDVDPALPPEELQAAIQQFSQEVSEEQEAERVAQADVNAAAGEAYLAENGAKEGVITTESGLQYEVISEGEKIPRRERHQRARELLERYVATLEDYCRRWPYQWFNFYDYWDGEPDDRAT